MLVLRYKLVVSRGCLTGCASTSQTQCEHAHGYYATAFSSVDVGVCGEDVRDRLRGVRLESHFCGWILDARSRGARYTGIAVGKIVCLVSQAQPVRR